MLCRELGIFCLNNLFRGTGNKHSLLVKKTCKFGSLYSCDSVALQNNDVDSVTFKVASVVRTI